jgi:hypothetical protein
MEHFIHKSNVKSSPRKMKRVHGKAAKGATWRIDCGQKGRIDSDHQESTWLLSGEIILAKKGGV